MSTLSSDLPVFQVMPQLVASIARHAMVILQAQPGAGKSTQVPLALLTLPELAGQKIIMLEPRRLAAKRLAHFIAQQLGEPVGKTVGYRVRNAQRVSEQTRLEIVTEGVFTRMLQSDPELQNIGLVIFDEFHERNLQADLGLSLLLEVQAALREDLKCLIMSATLDERSLKEFLPAGKFLFCEGRSFPVECSYHPSPANTPMPAFPQLPGVLRQALQETQGDVLLFFAGQGELLKALQQCQMVCETFAVEALPLYGALDNAQQDRVFQASDPAPRKVIFSTNIAETSITLQGITAVIDSGLEKQLNFDPNVGMSRLQLQRISKASATQRAGRAGRVQAGRCYRLWSETQQTNLVAHHQPEICRVDLAALRMAVAQWGAQPETIAWLTKPPSAHLAAAEKLLQQFGWLSRGRLTAAGKSAKLYHPEPRFAQLLAVAKTKGCLPLGCYVVALLQEGELLRDRTTTGVDLEHRLHWIWQAEQNPSLAKRFRRGAWRSFLQSLHRLKQHFGLQQTGNHPAQPTTQGLAQMLALAFPDRIGKSTQAGAYKLSNGRGAELPQGDALQAQWIVALELNAQVNSRQKNARIHRAVALDWHAVAEDLPLQTRQKVVFNPAKQRVEAAEETWLDQLLISRRPVDHLNAEQAQQCLLSAIQKDWSVLPWSKAAQAMLQRAHWLSQFSGFETFAGLSPQNLQSDLQWLAPYTLNMSKVSELSALSLKQILQSLLDYQSVQLLDQQAPENYCSPAGKSFAIQYSGTTAKVSLPLQQLFGELSSPKLAGGQVALTFELLSPAQRPIQTTADLETFWKTSYYEVAKEMRGRYPKHRWPDAPLEEKAGRSLKAKKES